MDVKLSPSKLHGHVEIPSSKSVAHRLIICAALSNGTSTISNVTMSQDILATINAIKQLGAKVELNSINLKITGINEIPNHADIDCNESGSTLRFLIPVAAALGISSTFYGSGKLPSRPITPYIRELSKSGITFNYNNTLPFKMSGKLQGGIYNIEGGISSQFITGLLFALPLCNNDSQIILSSKLESKPYVDITIDCLKKYGIKINEIDNGYYIKGRQNFTPFSTSVEGDYSQAAFFYVANALGSNVDIGNLKNTSKQGDKKIIEILNQIGYNKTSKLKGFTVDASDIPDLVPILTVLGCFGSTVSRITNAGRLRIKESDRLTAIATVLNKLGGKITVLNDGLVIEPIKTFHGETVDSFNDHRIVMSLAVASTICDGDITILNADAVKKSYPEFFEDFIKLGGIKNVINVEQ